MFGDQVLLLFVFPCDVVESPVDIVFQSTDWFSVTVYQSVWLLVLQAMSNFSVWPFSADFSGLKNFWMVSGIVRIFCIIALIDGVSSIAHNSSNLEFPRINLSSLSDIARALREISKFQGACSALLLFAKGQKVERVESGWCKSPFVLVLVLLSGGTGEWFISLEWQKRYENKAYQAVIWFFAFLFIHKGNDLGHCLIQFFGNGLIQLNRVVQGSGQRRVFKQNNIVFGGNRPNS